MQNDDKTAVETTSELTPRMTLDVLIKIHRTSSINMFDVVRLGSDATSVKLTNTKQDFFVRARLFDDDAWVVSGMQPLTTKPKTYIFSGYGKDIINAIFVIYKTYNNLNDITPDDMPYLLAPIPLCIHQLLNSLPDEIKAQINSISFTQGNETYEKGLLLLESYLRDGNDVQGIFDLLYGDGSYNFFGKTICEMMKESNPS